MKSAILKIPSTTRIYFVWVSLGLFCLSCVLYVFFIQKAVFNTVARSDIEKEMRILNGKVSTLEAEYIAIENSVNLETAAVYGLKEAVPTQYISRRALGTALSFKNEL